LHVSYTTEGLKGLIKDGGSTRQAAAEEALKSVRVAGSSKELKA
jgi:hypothetical protein